MERPGNPSRKRSRAEDLTEEFLKEAEEQVASVPVLIVSPAKEAEAEEPFGRPVATEPVAPTEEQAAQSVNAQGSGRPESGASPEQAHPADPADSGRSVDASKSPATGRRVVAAQEAGRSLSRLERPEEENEVVKMTQAALRTLGFRAREASEAAERARENLLSQGRAAGYWPFRSGRRTFPSET